MKSIEEVKAAYESGQKIHWINEGYSLRKSKSGDWWIDCVNGSVTPLNGYKAEDFFAAK